MMMNYQYNLLQLTPLFQLNCVVLRELENLLSVFSLKGKKEILPMNLLLFSSVISLLALIINCINAFVIGKKLIYGSVNVLDIGNQLVFVL